MNQRNYRKEMESVLADPAQKGKILLLHSCCAPCSSYCMELLCKTFRLIVYYYNPNIAPEEEYRKRAEEEKRLIGCYNREIEEGLREGYPIRMKEGPYDPALFYEAVRGVEHIPEGGERCFRCFALRLRKTAEAAREAGADYFTTTLTISPLKNAAKLNEIGEEIAGREGLLWLPSDFKKREGYKRSIELSNEYKLYRQNFCGCVYSKFDLENKDE